MTEDTKPAPEFSHTHYGGSCGTTPFYLLEDQDAPEYGHGFSVLVWYDDLCRLEASRAELLAALKAVTETGDDCPMCDRGRLRNPEKTHWPECPFGRAQAVIAKFAPSAVEAKEPQ